MTKASITAKSVLAILIAERAKGKVGWLPIPAIALKLGWVGKGDWLACQASIHRVLEALMVVRLVHCRIREYTKEYRADATTKLSDLEPTTSNEGVPTT